MKFCLVTETFPPEINGVAMTLGKLSLLLAKRGVEVSIVRPRQEMDSASSKANSPYQEYLVKGMRIPSYPDLQFGFTSKRFLKQIWEENRPDIVHVTTEGPLGLLAISATQKMGIPTTSSFHTNFHSYGNYYLYRFLIKSVFTYLKYFHNRTHATFVPDAKLKNTLEESGFERVQLLSRGVDTKLFSRHRRSEALRENWGVCQDDPVILYVGRIAQEKNLKQLVSIYEKLKQHTPSISLVMVGEGPYRTTLEKKHPDIHFCGSKVGEDLAAHYASGDLFIFPSTTETFGNVVTEAMACELPVLAFDYAAPGQFIKHNVNGFLAPFGDHETFMKEAIKLINKRSEWQTIGASARQQMLKVSWDEVVDQFVKDIEEIHCKKKRV
jgi:glycosyltransferase involved in cell wall biosynthesis